MGGAVVVADTAVVGGFVEGTGPGEVVAVVPEVEVCAIDVDVVVVSGRVLLVEVATVLVVELDGGMVDVAAEVEGDTRVVLVVDGAVEDVDVSGTVGLVVEARAADVVGEPALDDEVVDRTVGRAVGSGAGGATRGSEDAVSPAGAGPGGGRSTWYAAAAVNPAIVKAIDSASRSGQNRTSRVPPSRVCTSPPSPHSPVTSVAPRPAGDEGTV